MKKIFTSIFLAAAIMLTACGCEKGNADDPDEEIVEEADDDDDDKKVTTEAETSAPETTPETTVETSEATTTATEEAVTEDEAGAPEVVGTGLIQNSKKGDGFITYDREALEADIAAAGMATKELSAETVLSDFELYGNTATNLYKFTMLSAETVKGYESSDGTIVYMLPLVYDDASYIVSFGTSEGVTHEETIPYCTEGKIAEYWAFATVNDGMIMLMPFIGGSQTNGYYLVTPVLKMMGQDVSGMTIPDPIGDDYKYDMTLDKQPEGSVVLNITDVDNSDFITTAYCTLTNTYSVPVCLIGEQLLINGVDCSDKFTAFFTVEAGGIAEDCFYLDETQLYAGDKLEIIFSVQNDETYEDYGKMRFEIILEG